MEFIESHPDKQWNWYWISQNTGITMEFIESHPDKPWDWWGISYNKFNKDKTVLKKINKRIEQRELTYYSIKDYIIPDVGYLVVIYL
jgi:hypothetical protein